MKSDRSLPYEEAMSVSDCFDELFDSWTDEEIDKFLQECGLVSTHNFGFWLNQGTEVSFLKIIDKQKYFLSKIKYGF